MKKVIFLVLVLAYFGKGIIETSAQTSAKRIQQIEEITK
jgi:hypothetical protein